MVRYYESFSTGDGKYYYPNMHCDHDDTKPKLNVAQGSMITEDDTGLVSLFSEGNNDWIPQFHLKEEE